MWIGLRLVSLGRSEHGLGGLGLGSAPAVAGTAVRRSLTRALCWVCARDRGGSVCLTHGRIGQAGAVGGPGSRPFFPALFSERGVDVVRREIARGYERFLCRREEDLLTGRGCPRGGPARSPALTPGPRSAARRRGSTSKKGARRLRPPRHPGASRQPPNRGSSRHHCPARPARGADPHDRLQGRPQRSLPLRQRKEVQEVLRALGMRKNGSLARPFSQSERDPGVTAPARARATRRR
jgi:hypothetical protein